MDDTTLEGIVDAERDFVLTAEEKYGSYFTHAIEMVTISNNPASSNRTA